MLWVAEFKNTGAGGKSVWLTTADGDKFFYADLDQFGLGLSLGGPTGYAINPARDLGPRIVHFFLPIKGKRDSDWKYFWVPVLGPFIGAAMAAVMFLIFNSGKV